jgi:Fe-S cluster biogenesis protein NfuA
MKSGKKSIDLLQNIKDTIESLRVYINSDGGDISLADFKDGIVTIKITGSCVGCSMFSMTFDQGVKETLMVEHPEIKDVRFII